MLFVLVSGTARPAGCFDINGTWTASFDTHIGEQTCTYQSSSRSRP
jgi:hypothetical protein